MVKYAPDINQPEYPMLLYKKKMKLMSMQPLKCYGDSTILSKMKLNETSPDETLVDMLGPIGSEIPSIFKRIDSSHKHFQEKYKCDESNGKSAGVI